MEHTIVKGIYKRYPTRYYACFVDGKLMISTRKSDLPKVDAEFVLPARKLDKHIGAIVVGCPKCQKAHAYRFYSSFCPEAANIAKDCQEYATLVDLYYSYHTAGLLVLDALKSGKKISEIPETMKRRMKKSEKAREAAKKLLDLDILTEEVRATLVSLLLGFWR